MSHNDVKVQYYRIDFGDRLPLYSDLIMVALNAMEYLKSNNWNLPELDRENVRDRLMFGLAAVVSAAGSCICDLEASCICNSGGGEAEKKSNITCDCRIVSEY